MPIATAIAVATSTCDAVSIAGSQTPMMPIASSIAATVTAGREAGDHERDRDQPGDRDEPRQLGEQDAQRLERVLDEEVPDRLRDPEDERVGILT